MAARRPILVTGVPRSGTTWLARQLANASGSSMTGREPMNPHGKQYALGGTIDAWARIVDPTPKQRRVDAGGLPRHDPAGVRPRTGTASGRPPCRGRGSS